MRASTSFPKKTALGVEEMRQRTHGLSQRHRTMLLLVNGKRERAEVLALAGQAGVDAAVLDELVALGLVDDGRIALPDPLPAPAAVLPIVPAPATAPPPDPEPPPPSPPPLAAPEEPAPPAAPATPTAPAARVRATPAVHRPKPPPRAAVPAEVRRFDKYPALTAAKPPSRRRAPSISPPAAPADEAAEQRLLAEARTLLIGTLLVEGPVTSSMTALRVRKARTRDELAALVWDIERRLIVARRAPEAQARLKRARELLGLGNTVVEGEDEPDDRDTVS